MQEFSQWTTKFKQGCSNGNSIKQYEKMFWNDHSGPVLKQVKMWKIKCNCFTDITMAKQIKSDFVIEFGLLCNTLPRCLNLKGLGFLVTQTSDFSTSMCTCCITACFRQSRGSIGHGTCSAKYSLSWPRLRPLLGERGLRWKRVLEKCTTQAD